MEKRLVRIHLFIMGFLLIMFFTFFSSAYSNLEINSTNYSGFITQGSSSGNFTNGSYAGDSASFYQQAIGYLNDLLFSGVHSFSFNVSAPTGYSPSLSITLPQNATYIVRTSIPLNFTATLQEYIIYNIDNGANSTISGNTTFNTTNGLHTLYLFANNTYGNISVNVTFTANTSRLVVHYGNYSGASRGGSNDFNTSTYEELQNLSNIILENTNYGKIKFNTALNLTNDSVISDNDLDLDSYTNISSNSITVNSTVLPNLNKSATIYLYNLSFTNPRVLRDGSACPSTICTEVNYSSGTFVFNVTQFSTYSADETPVETTTTTTTSGGGGGGSVTYATTFTLNKNQISVTLNPGQVKTEEITITNTGSQTDSFKIDNLFQDFVVRGEDTVVLNPGESKTIPLYILARVDTTPDLYLGKIIVSSSNVKKEILIAVEVESEGILLDVRAEILDSYRVVLPGEEVLSEIRLFNLGGDSGRNDVTLEYIVRDHDNKEIVKETESLAIETQATFVKKISVPEGANAGNYVLYVRATYNGKVASASDNFEVVSSKASVREKIYIVTIIILVIILSLIFYIVTIRGGSSKKTGEKVDLRKIMKK